MKIVLEYPYSEVWKSGYLVTNKQNRKNVLLVNGKKDRTTTSYARYLMSVKLKRFLTATEEVDHRDDDKTNDIINNLQILTPAENRLKRNLKEKSKWVTLKCPVCSAIFERKHGNTCLVESHKMRVSCCSKTCSYDLKKISMTEDERIELRKELVVEIFFK